LVTARDREDGSVRELRRTGVPYVLVSAPRVLAWSASAADQLHGRKRVIVPATVNERAVGAPTTEELAAAVVTAITDDQAAGRTLSVAAARGLVGCLAPLQLVPVVGRWSAVHRWLGAPTLDIDDAGRLTVAARAAAPRSAQPAAVAASS
jgi:hypothetical protein